MVESSRLVCRFGHVLHGRNSTLMKHSQTGKTWIRCLICHAARQRKARRKREQNQMSKKDYEFIASVIRDLDVTGGMKARIARAFASELLNTNPRFKLQQFIDACVKETVP